MSETEKKERLSDNEAAFGGKLLANVINNVEKVIIGKHDTVELVLIALVTGGHVLIEDVPGVGKTSLVHAVAKSVNCGFSRIQFTPDLMPSDVTGFSVYNQKSGEFEFRPGGIMSNLVLADEINRASPKTQASLLEAMEERQVTVDSQTYPLEPPFMVLATQNPLEAFGTYPLPEAQMDRFLFKLSMGYPTLEEECQVIQAPRRARQNLKPVIGRPDVVRLADMAGRVYVDEKLVRYIAELTSATRTSADTALGASPRAGIALYGASQARALLRGRSYVLPDDIKALAPHVLTHRLILNHEAQLARKTALDVVEAVLDSVLVPVAD